MEKKNSNKIGQFSNLSKTPKFKGTTPLKFKICNEFCF